VELTTLDATDHRPAHLRIAETIVANLVMLGAVALALLLVGAAFTN
jgi:hypothetical protein